jgi:hypothetical protein
VAAIALVNWRSRIEAGQRGEINARALIAPAIVALIVGHIADADPFEWVVVWTAAATCLLTQAAAAMWPERIGVHRPAPVQPLFTSPSAPPPVNSANRVSETVPLLDEVPQTPTVPDTGLAPLHATLSAPEFGSAQPSFVGRTANAGVALLGKLLLLIGVLMALSQDALLSHGRAAVERNLITDPDVQYAIQTGAPRGLPLAAVILGGLCLVAARRRQDVPHFLRACFGSVLVLVGAAFAVGAAGPALVALFGAADSSGVGRSAMDPGVGLVFSIAALFAGLVLLAWPRAQSRQPLVL